MRLLLVFACLLVAVVAFADKSTPEQLKSKADSSSGADQAKHSVDYAAYCAEAAAQNYADGKYDEARALLQQVSQYAGVAATASSAAGKRLKATEIGLRKIQSRLRQLQHTVEAEEQPSVQQAIDAVDAGRGKLIDRMFGVQHPAVEAK